MKHLLEHTKTQILQELDKLGGAQIDRPKLEYAYEDLLDSIDRVLDESEPESDRSIQDRFKELSEVSRPYEPEPQNTPDDDFKDFTRQSRNDPRERFNNPDSRRFGLDNKERSRNLAGNDPRKSSRPPHTPQAGLDSPFEKAGSGGEFDEHFNQTGEPEFDPEDHSNERHPIRDGSQETYEDLKGSIRSLTENDIDPDRLRELADIAEEAEDGAKIDPKDMSDDEFGKMLSRLRPNLVDWATGKAEDMFSAGREEIVQKIQEALQTAQEQSDGNIDLLRTFEEQVSDSLFDLSRYRDDYDPEYDDIQPGDANHDLEDQVTVEGSPEVADEKKVNEAAVADLLSVASATTNEDTVERIVETISDLTDRSEEDVRALLDDHTSPDAESFRRAFDTKV